MNSRKLHKIIGLILTLPMLGWCITGIIFFTKPGYKEAYEQLTVKTYPVKTSVTIPSSLAWNEVRVVNTILGLHLLIKQDGNYQQLDLNTLQPKAELSREQFQLLLEDAFVQNSDRYGDIVSIEGSRAKTSTEVEIVLDWNTLKLSQKGQDTKLIKTFYKIHYLQWTPYERVNQVLGIAGLILLILLTIAGIKMLMTKARIQKS